MSESQPNSQPQNAGAADQAVSSRPGSALATKDKPPGSRPQSAVRISADAKGGDADAGGSQAGSRPGSATGGSQANKSRPSSAKAGSQDGSQDGSQKGPRPGSAKDGSQPPGSRPDSASGRGWTRRSLTTKVKTKIIAYEEPAEDMELDEAATQLGTKTDELKYAVDMLRRKIYSREFRIASYKQRKLDEYKAKIEAKAAAKEAVKAAKKEAQRLENIKNGVMPGAKKKKVGDSDDEEEEESEEEESEDEDEEDEDEGGGKKKKDDNDPAPPDLDDEEREAEAKQLEEMEVQYRTNMKDLAAKIVSTRKSRDYLPEPLVIATNFLKSHYELLGDPQRDFYSLIPSYHPECEINLGSGRIFRTDTVAATAVILSMGDAKLAYDIKNIDIEKKWRRGLCLAFTVTVHVSVDGDKPRRVMECYELKKSKKEKTMDAYVIAKLLTILNDPRPLYIFSDALVERTRNDNMEPWARALMPLTQEEIYELELAAEAREMEEMTEEDAAATKREVKIRGDIAAAKRKAEAEAEKARKAAMFGDDDDDEEEGENGEEDEAEEEEAPEPEEKEEQEGEPAAEAAADDPPKED